MKVLFFLLLAPVFVFGTFKDEVIANFSTNLSRFDVSEAHRSLDCWETSYIEDKEIVDSCRAFIFLIEDKLDDAKSLFEASFFKLQQKNPALQQVADIFYHCLEYFESHSIYSQQINGMSARIFLCQKAWKIKAVIGAVMVGVGGIVSCVAPGAGVGIITTGVGLIVDGTAESIDENDRIKELDAERRRQEEELNKTSYNYPFIRRNVLQLVSI